MNFHRNVQGVYTLQRILILRRLAEDLFNQKCEREDRDPLLQSTRTDHLSRTEIIRATSSLFSLHIITISTPLFLLVMIDAIYNEPITPFITHFLPKIPVMPMM